VLNLSEIGLRVIEKKLAKFSDNQPSRLALGTAQFGLDYGIANKYGRVPEEEVGAILALCRSNRVNTLDTAIAYGESEACLGKIGVDGFKVVTKLPALPKNCLDIAAWVREETAASMTRLRVSKIYALLLHHPQDLFGSFGKYIFHALQDLKLSGLVEKIGVSIYDPSDIDKILKKYSVDIVQAPFNLVDRRLYQSGVLGQLKDSEIEVHVRSIFLQGLLLMPIEKIPHQFSQWSNLWTLWGKWLNKVNLTAPEACLAYALSFKEIDKIVIGTDNLLQLEQLISFASKAEPLLDFPDLCSSCEDLINPSRWKLA
jgi:aryl-alcohol dehydrogenase-like predicted oxidoreductase